MPLLLSLVTANLVLDLLALDIPLLVLRLLVRPVLLVSSLVFRYWSYRDEYCRYLPLLLLL